MGQWPSTAKIYTTTNSATTPEKSRASFSPVAFADEAVDVIDEATGRSVAGVSERLDWTAATGAEAIGYTIPGQEAGTCLRLTVAQRSATTLICWMEDPYAAVLPAAVKSYTYQRASAPVPATWGGAYARPAGHPDTDVRFHGTTDRDTTAAYVSPGGWYDAGDYGKYIVNAGYSIGVMLQLLDQYPNVLSDGTIGFGESEKRPQRPPR